VKHKEVLNASEQKKQIERTLSHWPVIDLSLVFINTPLNVVCLYLKLFLPKDISCYQWCQQYQLLVVCW